MSKIEAVIEIEGSARGAREGLGAIFEELKKFWLASWRRFLVIFVVLLLVYSAILLANSYYWDDIFREIQGFRGWQDFSRYASNYLAILFNTSGRLIDIAPLSHFIAIGFLALTACVLIYLFKVRIFERRVSVWDVCAMLLLVASPYYLECFVYKFDSPYMAVAVFATVMPFLVLRWGEKKIGNAAFYVAAFLGTLLMCTTYQAASGIFPLVVIFVGAAKFHQGMSMGEVLKFGVKAALAYGLAILVFKTFLMAPIDPSYASYVGNTVWGVGEFVPGFMRNLTEYYRYVVSDWRVLWLGLSGLLVVGFVVFATWRSGRNKFLALLVNLVVVALCGVLAFGLYPALANTTFDPRAFMGLGAVLALFALYVGCLEKALPAKLVVGALAYCFIVFAFIYGNTLRQQDNWNYYRTAALAEDLAELPLDGEKLVEIKGSIGVAKATKNYVEATGCGLLERLSFVALSDSRNAWGYYYLLNYFGLKDWKADKEEKVEKMEGLEVVKDTEYHRILVTGNNVLVELK